MVLKRRALGAIPQLACLASLLAGCGQSAANLSSGASSVSGNDADSAAAAPAPAASANTPAATTPDPAQTTTTTPAPTVDPSTGQSPAATPATLVTTGNSDGCLPLAMPSAAAAFAATKKVFAHYFYPFPLSIDNKSPAADYYNVNYLLKSGESNKWSQEGGYLRQRPLGVAASTNANWQQLNLQREVASAIARGITGFTFDVMSVSEATDPSSQLHLMLKAAAAVDSRFKIIVMPDLTALGTNTSSVVQIIAAVADSPAAYKLSDGRLVVSAFDAGLNSVAWWSTVLSELKTMGINVAFVPTFLGWNLYAKTFNSMSYGFAEWGTATAYGSGELEGAPVISHTTYDKMFVMPVDPQQYRPKDFIYWEAGNSAAFRAAWSAAIQGDADWVQLVTWNDLSESSSVAPYTDVTLNRSIGTGYYDLAGYYTAWFMTGNQPPITHDVLYYFYRREPTNAAGVGQIQADAVKSGDAENDIELLAFLTAPGTLKITIGGKTYTQNASAGIVSFKVPTQAGIPLFTLSRNGADVFSFSGGVQIYGTGGIPSGVLDMTYWSGSASKLGICAL
jgi:Glycosyl hydrolase family 71